MQTSVLLSSKPRLACVAGYLTAFFVLAALSPLSAQQMPVAYGQFVDQLGRAELGQGEVTEIGLLHGTFHAFDFDAEGRLFGITEDGLYRLDPQSALPEEIGPLGVSLNGEAGGEIDMAISPNGQLWISSEQQARTTLYRGPLASGQVTQVAQLDQEVTGIAFRGDQLVATADNRLFLVDPATSTLAPLGQPLPTGQFVFSDLAVIGDRFFAVGLQIIAPPFFAILELHPETGTFTVNEIGGFWGSGLAVREESCTPSDTVLCFGNGRFETRISWRDFEGNSGEGHRLPWTSEDSGLFQFFGPRNWEVLVKVISGCAFNQHVWVLASASTNVEFTLTVRDTLTGEEQSYTNPLGNPAGAILDTEAFRACP